MTVATEGAKRNVFSQKQYLITGMLEFVVLGVVLGVILRMGFLDGYFSVLPIVVLFYAVVGLGSGLLSRRMRGSTSVKVQSLLLTISLGRLFLVVAATALGLWLLPQYRWSFVLLSLVCYIVAVQVSLMAVLRK